MLHEVNLAYDALTCGRVSKPNTLSDHVIQTASECQSERIDEAITDVLDVIADCDTMDEVRGAVYSFRRTAATANANQGTL